MKLTIGEIVEATGGQLVQGRRGAVVVGVSTDSRTLKPGEIFFALHGEKHDGHDHLKEVMEKGAGGAVVERDVGAGFEPARTKNLIRVPDTLRALGDLAHAWRKRFDIPVVAVTGSNGKTTTKDMTAAILSEKYRVLKTEGNLNNLIGLPLTLFRLDEEAEAAVVEIGMNRLGEIDRLAEIAAPQVGVITNVARAHLEGLGSLARVARAKGELLGRLPREGLAVLNRDDPSYPRLKRGVRSRLATFGRRRGATVRLLFSRVEDLRGISFVASVKGKRERIRMPVLGGHNIANALAAIAVGDFLKIPVSKMRKALRSFHTLSKRMEIVPLPKGIDLINDCYNANPDSTAASLAFLKEAGAGRRRVAILGEMLELGSFATRAHREIGMKTARAADLLFAVGEHAGEMMKGFRRRGGVFETVEAAIPEIVKALRPGDLVLIKGSRGMQMERITEALKNVL
jgi:UDP-N-acetylmuramoyl-tripeptide--D-alanyl-D-alanine ligase